MAYITITTPEGEVMVWNLTPEKAAIAHMMLNEMENSEGSEIEKATRLMAFLNDFQNN
jgi:hypothetical protein